MKKLLALIALMAVCFGAEAQIVSTVSRAEKIEIQKKEKKPRTPIKLEWHAKLGLNLMSTQWNEFKGWSTSGGYGNPVTGSKTKAGVSLEVGFTSHFRPKNPSNFYWGANVGVTQVGGGFDEFSYTHDGYYYVNEYNYQSFTYANWGAFIGPSIGWEKPVAKNVKLDVHLNPEMLFLFGSGKYYDYHVANIADDGDTDEYDGTHSVSSEAINFSIRGGVGVWFNRINIDFSYRYVFSVWDPSDDNAYRNIALSVGYRF